MSRRQSVSRLNGNFKTFIALCIPVQSGHLWHCNYYKRKQIHTVLSGSQIQLLWIGPGGGTPLYGLDGMCRWTGSVISHESVLNRVYSFAKACPKQCAWY